jgi:hypothetical protein
LLREVKVLLAHDDHTDVRKLAEKADGLLALHQPQGHELAAVAAVATPDVAEEDAVPAAAINDQQGKKQKRKKRSERRRRSRSPEYQSPLCYFHVRYGDKAHRCEEPYAWPAGN